MIAGLLSEVGIWLGEACCDRRFAMSTTPGQAVVLSRRSITRLQKALKKLWRRRADDV